MLHHDGTRSAQGPGPRLAGGVSDPLPLRAEPPPEHGVPLPAAPGVRRVVAPNPGPMTAHGTNTWLVDVPGGVVVVDPGPETGAEAHVEAVLRAVGGAPVRRIVLTHTHSDHLGALPALRARCGAPTAGFERPQDAGFRPDLPLADGDAVEGLVALHTPGHASDHLCLALPDGVLLSGDHVMAWSTTVVSPPEGSMTQYFASLRRLLGREDRLLLPGHGPALPEPRPFLRAMLQHRLMREAAVLRALARGPQAVPELTAALYPTLEPRLVKAAGRSVLAHLLKLQEEGRATEAGEGWIAVEE